MAIKFEKVQPGMTLYDRHSHRMGNTTLRTIGEWRVEVISVDPTARSAVVSWNGNRPQVYSARMLSKLYDWSMEDEGVEVTRGSWDSVVKVRKTKKPVAKKA